MVKATVLAAMETSCASDRHQALRSCACCHQVAASAGSATSRLDSHIPEARVKPTRRGTVPLELKSCGLAALSRRRDPGQGRGQNWTARYRNPWRWTRISAFAVGRTLPTLGGRDDLLQELNSIVNEAQKRDAEDERRLYDPMLRDRPASFKQQR